MNLNGGLSVNTVTTLTYNLNLSASGRTGSNGISIYVGDLINLGGSVLNASAGSGSITFLGGNPSTVGDYD